MKRLLIPMICLTALAAGLGGRQAHAASAPDPYYHCLVARVGRALAVSPQLIHALIRAESNYDPSARSRAGAIGLMQLMPAAGARAAYRYLYHADGIPTDASLRRAEVSVWLGAAYLRLLQRRYFAWIADPGLRLRAVIAAYNWGPARVLAQLFPDRAQISETVFARRLRRLAPRETRRYLARVIENLRAGASLALASR